MVYRQLFGSPFSNILICNDKELGKVLKQYMEGLSHTVPCQNLDDADFPAVFSNSFFNVENINLMSFLVIKFFSIPHTSTMHSRFVGPMTDTKETSIFACFPIQSHARKIRHIS